MENAFMNPEIPAHLLPAECSQWMEAIGCAVTISDLEGRIIYMNQRARATYKAHGDLIGKNMMPCHSAASQALILRMLETGETHTYTVKKGGIRKLIFQSPWKKDGVIAGMVELSIPLPENIAHYDRDKA